MMSTIPSAAAPGAPAPFDSARHPSSRETPDLPAVRLIRAYLLEARCETLQALRTPAAAIPFLAIPAAIYLLFGVVLFTPGEDTAAMPGLENYIFSGFMVIAVAMPGLFGGCAVAFERDAGLLKLKRALPMPGGANLVAKAAMSMMFAAAASGSVVAIAVAADTITLSGAQVAVMWGVMIAGTVPFCAIGLLIGSLASASSAPAFANLVFLPMMWLSGLFIPLPEFLQPWVVVWPAFHLNQVALGAGGVGDYVYVSPQLALAVLAGITVLSGGLAIRRLSRVG
ncbi:MAG: ABC transporter permease [Gammaproteobacteria bacterium]|nr:ABC transporter permease [Gammaproteobacteria bacterium]